MSLFVHTLDKTGKINDPKHWADSEVIRRPEFDAVAFQQKIDDAIGLSKDRHSIVRLKWAWDLECYSERYTAWTSTGIPLQNEFRAKYRFTTIELPNGDKFEIPPPRWVLEELTAPEQYADAWEVSRWQFDANLGVRVPTKPPPPRDGYYVFLKYIAEHDPSNECCTRALNADFECVGVYRHPNETDITALKKTWQKIQRDKTQPSPYAPLSEDDLAIIQADVDAAERDEFEKKMTDEEERRKFHTKLVKPRQEYSLPTPVRSGERRTDAGLILLN